MREFLVLIGQILIISGIQMILDTGIDKNKYPGMLSFIHIACYLGSLYVIIQFIYVYIIQETISVFRIF